MANETLKFVQDNNIRIDATTGFFRVAKKNGAAVATPF
jgi:hypothetical protein